MDSLLDKQIVIKLNRLWTAVAVMSPRDAFVFLASEKDGQKPGFAMDFETTVDEVTGEHTLVYSLPVAWEDWVDLPVREGDLFIQTAHRRIRLPLVVICAKYAEIPKKTTRWSTGNVHKRDGFVCGYSGQKLSRADATVDHILPRSRGGRDTFENTTTCHRAINTRKGSMTPEEAGLTLLSKPKAPPVLPVIYRKGDAPVPEQAAFLIE